MAIKSARFRVPMEEMYDHGAYLVSQIEPLRDWDQSTKERFVQQVDPVTGLLVWVGTVLDGDPEARAAEKTVQIKFLAEVQPVPPPEMPGTPLRPVELEGLMVTPYLDDKRNRVAYSIRATGMKAPTKGPRPAPAEQGKSNS